MMHRIVEVLEKMDERLLHIEKALHPFTDKADEIARVLSSPSGYVTFGGRSNTSVADLRKAFDQSATAKLEEITVDFNFTQAVYMGLRPEKNQELQDLMSDGALKQMRNILKDASALSALVKKASEAAEAATAKAEKTIDVASVDVHSMVNRAVGVEVARLEKSKREIMAREDKVALALERVESALKRTEELTAQAGNILISATKPDQGSSFTSRRRK